MKRQPAQLSAWRRPWKWRLLYIWADSSSVYVRMPVAVPILFGLAWGCWETSCIWKSTTHATLFWLKAGLFLFYSRYTWEKWPILTYYEEAIIISFLYFLVTDCIFIWNTWESMREVLQRSCVWVRGVGYYIHYLETIPHISIISQFSCSREELWWVAGRWSCGPRRRGSVTVKALLRLIPMKKKKRRSLWKVAF
jgi:hypothetical protein